MKKQQYPTLANQQLQLTRQVSMNSSFSGISQPASKPSMFSRSSIYSTASINNNNSDVTHLNNVTINHANRKSRGNVSHHKTSTRGSVFSAVTSALGLGNYGTTPQSNQAGSHVGYTMGSVNNSNNLSRMGMHQSGTSDTTANSARMSSISPSSKQTLTHKYSGYSNTAVGSNHSFIQSSMGSMDNNVGSVASIGRISTGDNNLNVNIPSTIYSPRSLEDMQILNDPDMMLDYANFNPSESWYKRNGYSDEGATNMNTQNINANMNNNMSYNTPGYTGSGNGNANGNVNANGAQQAGQNNGQTAEQQGCLIM